MRLIDTTRAVWLRASGRPRASRIMPARRRGDDLAGAVLRGRAHVVLVRDDLDVPQPAHQRHQQRQHQDLQHEQPQPGLLTHRVALPGECVLGLDPADQGEDRGNDERAHHDRVENCRRHQRGHRRPRSPGGRRSGRPPRRTSGPTGARRDRDDQTGRKAERRAGPAPRPASVAEQRQHERPATDLVVGRGNQVDRQARRRSQVTGRSPARRQIARPTTTTRTRSGVAPGRGSRDRNVTCAATATMTSAYREGARDAGIVSSRSSSAWGDGDGHGGAGVTGVVTGRRGRRHAGSCAGAPPPRRPGRGR